MLTILGGRKWLPPILEAPKASVLDTTMGGAPNKCGRKFPVVKNQLCPPQARKILGTSVISDSISLRLLF